MSRKRVARLMRNQGLVGRRRGRRFVKTTDSRHPFPIAANILMREFAVPAANVAWATDITYLWTAEGWLYLAAILDLFSRRVVGFAMGDQITRELPLTALRRALSHRPDTRNLIHHSDRGSTRATTIVGLWRRPGSPAALAPRTSPRLRAFRCAGCVPRRVRPPALRRPRRLSARRLASSQGAICPG